MVHCQSDFSLIIKAVINDNYFRINDNLSSRNKPTIENRNTKKLGSQKHIKTFLSQQQHRPLWKNFFFLDIEQISEIIF